MEKGLAASRRGESVGGQSRTAAKRGWYTRDQDLLSAGWSKGRDRPERRTRLKYPAIMSTPPTGVEGPTILVRAPILSRFDRIRCQRVRSTLFEKAPELDHEGGGEKSDGPFPVQQEREDTPGEQSRSSDDERSREALRVDGMLRDGEETDCGTSAVSPGTPEGEWFGRGKKVGTYCRSRSRTDSPCPIHSTRIRFGSVSPSREPERTTASIGGDEERNSPKWPPCPQASAQAHEPQTRRP